MDESNPLRQSPPTSSKPLSEAELRYYYSGFYKTLKRHRSMTIIGWMVVLVGCVSFPIGWSLGRSGGIVEILLSCSTILAGLGLVWQSISSLEAYIKIAPPFLHNGETHPLVHEVVEMMKDVDDGGWQDAYAALGRIEELRNRYDLPSLN